MSPRSIASCASTTSSAGSTDPPKPVVVTDRLPERAPPRPQVHRLRARRQALRAGRRAVQHLRARPRPLRAIITRMNPDGQRLRGLRARRAQHRRLRLGSAHARELWFTDNGRDMLGDDVPPDELEPRAEGRACISAFRTATAATIADPGVRPQARVQRVRAAGAEARRRTSPRSACASTPAAQFPAAYRKQIFIAEHGSWNRSRKIGYRVTLVTLEGGKAVSLRAVRRGLAAGRAARGAVRRTCWSCRTARCWCRTTTPGRSTASATPELASASRSGRASTAGDTRTDAAYTTRGP